jgi:anti-sigma factor RsiW
MSHLSEKIAEFVFEELSPSEMAEARRHLSECSHCREQVTGFQSTYTMLKTSPDMEPPRQIMFEFEKPRVAAWIWRWLAPMAASAAVALAVVSLAPRPQPQIIERVVQQQVAAQSSPAAQAVAAQSIDYRQIQAWLNSELKKRDAAQAKDIVRVQAAIEALDNYQRQVYRETEQNAGAIQMLAKLTETR